MARIPRIMIVGEPTAYHVISRTALDGFPIGDVEKDYYVGLIRRLNRLYFAKIIGFCFTLLNSLRNNVLHLCAAK